MESNKKNRVVVGMSGGVDSSVAAVLLLEQGYDVVGLFMHNWEETENGFCTAEQDYSDVKSVCDSIGIPYYSVNFSAQYLDRVFTHFLHEYSHGRTPNPDVLCNREIKFDAFKTFCGGLEARNIATGHYCGLEKSAATNTPLSGNLRYFFHLTRAEAQGKNADKILPSIPDFYHRLKRASCVEKDQTYFLNQLSQEQLDGVIFPLANMQKSEVREVAKRHGLSTAGKKDSTGICFIGERKFKDFLKTYLPAKSGEIRTLSGEVIGTHDGLMYYTLGQRKGLGIGGRVGHEGRWFVIKKDLSTNVLYVHDGEHSLLFSDGLVAEGFNFIAPEFIEGVSLGADEVSSYAEFSCMAKFRYRQPDQAVRVRVRGTDSVEIEFADRQRAITEGQYAVLYQGDYCLGGGVIARAIRRENE